MTCQENIWSLFEQVRLDHLMIEAAGRVMEALVSKKVDVDTALGFVYLGNLGRGDAKVSVEVHEEEKQDGRMQQSKHSGGGQKEEERKYC